jgi:hypothetical protein
MKDNPNMYILALIALSFGMGTVEVLVNLSRLAIIINYGSLGKPNRTGAPEGSHTAIGGGL